MSTKTKAKEEVNHAEQNAKAWAKSIAAMAAALNCDYDKTSAMIEGDEFDSFESAQERVQESPLSVEVRSGWTSPGNEMQAEDFCILLSTGGPALRIIGELTTHKQPCCARLEYQDWGTPWTEYHGDECSDEDLLTFCQQFYFGE